MKLKKDFIIITIIFLVALLFRLWGINSQGETWDEIAYFNAGKVYYNNIQHRDFYAPDWVANKEHPPIAKYIYGLVSIPSYIIEEVDYTNGRIASAIMGSLTVVLVYLISFKLFDRKNAILASLILAFLPSFIAYNKVYGLDTPTILFFTLTVYLFLLAVKRKNNLLYLLTTISLGLAIATRFNNFLLFILLPIIYFIIMNKKVFQPLEKKFLWYIFIMPTIALEILILSWPWLWWSNLDHWKITLGHWTPVKDYFLGKFVSAGFSYYPMYFLVATPAILIILWAISFYVAYKKRNINYWVIIAWFFVPFLWTFASVKQNGVRYILTVYPALAIMVSWTFWHLVEKISNKKITYSLAGLLIGYLLVSSLLIHPYYLDYFNEFVGGPSGVYNKRLFPIGWWGEGVEEATIWLSNNAPYQSKIWINTIPSHTTGEKLRSDLIKTKDDPDFVLINPASQWYDKIDIGLDNYEVVHTVRAQGVPIVTILKKQ